MLQKKFITQHGDLISHEGLVWYEIYGNAAMPSVDGESLWKRYEIDQITKADMQPLYQKELQRPYHISRVHGRDAFQAACQEKTR